MMTPPFRTERRDKRRSVRELVSGAGVALLHAIVIAALVKATYVAIPNHPVAREIEIWFIFPPKPQTRAELRPKNEKAKSAKQITPETTIIPDYSHIALPPSWGEKNADGLNRSLFGCEPDQIALLPPEERAKCPSIAAASRDRDKDAVDYLDHTGRSKDRLHWARGRDRKNLPLLLPCASPYGVGVGLGTLLCLAKGVAKGFDPDNQPGYMDKPVVIHLPNNGDPSTIYEPGN
ncbi:MAG TPA: hypothetical protein VG891_12670 [Rhizomicrobium sp.]|jgi:hypothetical protein|nr:hypothetical protein [Rhizomicrobium sp.]